MRGLVLMLIGAAGLWWAHRQRRSDEERAMVPRPRCIHVVYDARCRVDTRSMWPEERPN